MEEWKPVVGYEELYAVSNLGRVKRLQGTYHLADSSDYTISSHLNRGYLRVTLFNGRRRGHAVHRLVLEAFHGPCLPGKECNHKNAVKRDNRSSNLEWVTSKENKQHAIKQGLMPRGERQGLAKLTEDDVRFIRQHAQPGISNGVRQPFSYCGLARQFGVSDYTIMCVVNRKTWKHVE